MRTLERKETNVHGIYSLFTITKSMVFKILKTCTNQSWYKLYTKIYSTKNCWWSQTGSNRRPPACKAGALPAELWPPRSATIKVDHLVKLSTMQIMVGLGRLELPTSRLSGVRSNQLSYRPKIVLLNASILPSLVKYHLEERDAKTANHR